MDCGCPMPSPRMRVKELLFSACLVISAIAFITKAALSMPTDDRADLPLIKSSIIAYNAEHHKKSLSDDSYRGEEGILLIRPEVARSLGLNVFINPDYLKAKELYERAEELLGKTVEAMKTQKKEKLPGEHVQEVYETAVLYNKTLKSARKHMAAYRASLTPGTDDRLNPGICSELLEKLLRECLNGASHNLREALGCFYNKCQDLDGGGAPLNPENMEFVNHVFREFLEKAEESSKESFDLDRQNQDPASHTTDYGSEWKHVVGDVGSHYVALLEPVLKDEEKAGYSVDPLLLFALIKQESDFDPRAVSDVGAVGLTQIIPETAKDLGMITIFMPEYLDEAKSFMGKERRLKRQAMALIREIANESMLESAAKARQLMQEALDLGQGWKMLYARYRQELLKENKDDRLDPVKAIKHGLRYFVTMMRMHEGDISLALAAYNAGPHRVKQYGGIPPFAETILFRNNVLGYYRDYRLKLKETGTP
jgi:hypothetical protein